MYYTLALVRYLSIFLAYLFYGLHSVCIVLLLLFVTCPFFLLTSFMAYILYVLFSCSRSLCLEHFNLYEGTCPFFLLTSFMAYILYVLFSCSRSLPVHFSYLPLLWLTFCMSSSLALVRYLSIFLAYLFYGLHSVCIVLLLSFVTCPFFLLTSFIAYIL